MAHTWILHKGRICWSVGCLLLIILLAGCGSSASPTTSANDSSYQHSASNSSSSRPMQAAAANNGANSSQSNAGTGGQQNNTPAPQYLIKTLKATLDVKDTRKVADILQTWITTTDPHATSAGTDYEQTSDTLYTVNMTFSVQSTLYPQIYQYVRDYTLHNGGRLGSFNESVQDVTGDFVDTQSRLTNLHTEQTRLQDLMSHAQSLADVITIEQKLSDVEGTIESDEAHLNMLTSQVSFYTVTINLQPIETAPAPTPSGNSWSFGQVLHDAFIASVSFAQALITFLIWLLAFCVYLIPVAVIIFFVRKWRMRNPQILSHPKVATAAPLETEEVP